MISFPEGPVSVAAVGGVKTSDPVSKAGKLSEKDTKIEKSARDFEAILLGNWLQQAEESFAKVPGGDEDQEDNATAQFTQMSMQSLGASFAGTGGIGIAKMISSQLHRGEEAADAARAAANTKDSSVHPTGVLHNFSPLKY